MPPAGAGADDPHLAVARGQRAQPLRAGDAVVDDLRVGDAAIGAHLLGHVVGLSMARALVEVGADRVEPMLREAARELAVELIPSGHVVDEDDAGKRPLALGLGDVGVDPVAVGADDLCNGGGHAVDRSRVEGIPSRHGQGVSFRYLEVEKPRKT